MASAEIQRLWKLHRIDAGILEVRKRAAALDVGQRLAAEVELLSKQYEEVGGNAKRLSGELQDLELQQKSIDDKIKRYDAQLYGGTVVNPREVENIEKEIAMLKRQRGVNDEKILQLWEVVPPAKEAAAKLEKQIEERKTQILERRKKAVAEKTLLEQRFAELNKSRPAVAATVPPHILARYEGVRAKHETGMAEATSENSCGACGTLLAERAMVALKEDKLVPCESCHRFLYYTTGAI